MACSPRPDGLLQALHDADVGAVRSDASLRDLTTLKVGGPARALVTVETATQLVEVARIVAAHEAPWLVVGRGSNLLVGDDGIDGVVIALGRGFRGVEPLHQDPGTPDVGDEVDVLLGAAEPMPVLANNLEKRGLGGMAFAVAIPGVVGGAVRMNAGAHGGQMADVLQWAEGIRLSSGTSERWTAEDLQMTYRHTALPADAVVTRACVRLRRDDRETLAADMAEMRRWRREHQPINEPSCGSVFRNPEGDSAGRLIEAAGLKGYRVGGAEVSHKHANFITVSPGATAGDVHAVIRHVQRTVAQTAGVHLRTEVVTVGFDEGEAAADG